MAEHKLTAEEQKFVANTKRTSKGAYKKSKTTEPKARGQQLPGGIIGGLARLTKYKVGIAKNKYPYVMVTGIVIDPKEHSGARAVLSYFLSPPKSKLAKTLQQRYDDMFADFQILGIPTSDMKDGTVLEEVIKHLKGLVEQKPVFVFNTWKRDAESDTMCFLQRLADAEDMKDLEDSVYEEEEEENEDEESEGESEDEDEEEGEEEVDKEGGDEEEEEEEEEEEWEPIIGEVYGYRVKKGTAAFPCEVTKVSVKNETVDLKRQKDGKKFLKKSWESLEDFDKEE